MSSINYNQIECCICGKTNLTDFNKNKFILKTTTPAILKTHLFRQGKRYNSHFYQCYNCCKSTGARKRLIIKKKCFLITQDFLAYKGGDIRTKSYWFTIELNIYGNNFIYDRKTKQLVKVVWSNLDFGEEPFHAFLDSIRDDVWRRVR